MSCNDPDTTPCGTGPETPAAASGPRIRTVRRLALAVAVVGLLVLYRAARDRELPWVSATDLTPSMQFAPVRARGILAQPARIHERDGHVTVLAFGLRENGEVIHGVAFGETARVLARKRIFSEPGRGLQITGVVQFSPRYGPQIHIRSPEHVEPWEPATPEHPP